MQPMKMRCLIWGTGGAWETRKYSLNHSHIEIVGFIDNDLKKIGKEIEGFIIDTPQNINNYVYDMIFIMSRYGHEIRKQLQSYGIEEKKILDAYRVISSSHSLARSILANQYIKYDEGYVQGIEIGGANNPINLERRISILQVDCCEHVDDAYSELNLVEIDLIDDGEKLEKVQDNSLDFIVACHMIEHCINPIGTIRNFIKKIRQGGIVFLAIPDKRYTFDKDRKNTTIEHLILDDTQPTIERDFEHFEEEKITIEYIKECREAHVHHHVWDDESWRRFIEEVKKHLDETFTIKLCGNFNEYAGNEITCILKKN